MSALSDLLHEVEQRAEAEPDSVLPVLRMLADPDGDLHDDTVVHEAARRINRVRLDAQERTFRQGALDTAAAREVVGTSRQAVNERVRTGSLLAARVAGRLMYPGWQFTATDYVDGLPEVAQALHETTGGDARQADVIMRAPQPELGGRPLTDLLGRDTDELVRRIVMRSDQS